MARSKKNFICEIPSRDYCGISRESAKSYEDMRIAIKFMRSCSPLQRIDILRYLQEMIADDFANLAVSSPYSLSHG